MTTAVEETGASIPALGRLLRGTFWLGLRSPLQAVFALWTVRLILRAIGEEASGAYAFAWGFGFLQFLLEFGMGSALQRRIAEAWTRDDREAIDRVVACGLWLYAAMAAIQSLLLLGIAYGALPFTDWHGPSYRLIVKLIWLQILVAPCYGLSMIVTSLLQAARRYDVLPRLDFLAVILRFAILFVGLRSGCDFFATVVVQTLVGIGISLGPGLWVVARELGYRPRMGAARWSEMSALTHVAFSMFLIQVSVVLSDKMDTTILGFALSDPGPATAVYAIVSRPFLQLRQAGWLLSSLAMPAAAGLLATKDRRAVERMTYDGSRLLIGLILPVALLAWIDAGPFLSAWVGPRFAREAPLLRLFLIAAAPLALAIPVQVAIAEGRLRFIATASLIGALVNFPLSYYLTTRIGVAGVIWGSVLTVTVSNFLLPMVYLFRSGGMRPSAFFAKSLAAPLSGALAMIVVTWASRSLVADVGGMQSRVWPLLLHLSMGSLAYVAGYMAEPTGRGDLGRVIRK